MRAMEYAVAAFHDKIYAARLAYNSKTAAELKREAATARDKLRAAEKLPRWPRCAHSSRER